MIEAVRLLALRVTETIELLADAVGAADADDAKMSSSDSSNSADTALAEADADAIAAAKAAKIMSCNSSDPALMAADTAFAEGADATCVSVGMTLDGSGCIWEGIAIAEAEAMMKRRILRGFIVVA